MSTRETNLIGFSTSALSTQFAVDDASFSPQPDDDPTTACGDRTSAPFPDTCPRKNYSHGHQPSVGIMFKVICFVFDGNFSLRYHICDEIKLCVFVRVTVPIRLQISIRLGSRANVRDSSFPVSYTHLTLPTIYSV